MYGSQCHYKYILIHVWCIHCVPQVSYYMYSHVTIYVLRRLPQRINIIYQGIFVYYLYVNSYSYMYLRKSFTTVKKIKNNY